MTKTFRSAGDLGDIIYSLPVVRALGGGIFYIEASQVTRQCLTRDKWAGIDLLLRKQPYIADVREWRGEVTEVCLNDFRPRLFARLRKGYDFKKSLADWMLETHLVPATAKDKAWLTVEPRPVAPVVINRTGTGRRQCNVYHNPQFPWHRVWQKYRDKAVFIGLPEEHEVFCNVIGDIRYERTDSLLDAARVIAGCDLFIGNQSCPHAIAEGLKKRIVLEVWPGGPNCLFEREGVVHGWDHKVKLPEL